MLKIKKSQIISAGIFSFPRVQIFFIGSLLYDQEHPVILYDFDISGNGVLNFRFNNVMLPDSNVNAAASNRFVKFKVAQKANLDLETKIYNSAAIYFDFNPPVITNQILHTIGEDFVISVSIDPVENPLAQEVFKISCVFVYSNLAFEFYEA
ncbi:MAG: hypothetical protein ACI8P3_003832 [Saprospiraceae bacterium]